MCAPRQEIRDDAMTIIMPSCPEIWGPSQICTTHWQEGRNKNFVTAVSIETRHGANPPFLKIEGSRQPPRVHGYGHGPADARESQLGALRARVGLTRQPDTS